MYINRKQSEVPLYEEVATQIIQMIDSGALAVGSRAPSVRSLSAQLKTSISTVIAAYRVLEDRGRLQARPQSGFYVRALRRENVAEPEMSRPPETAHVVTVGDLGHSLLTEFFQPGIIALGAANGAVSDWSMKAVNSLMNSISRSQPLLSAAYAPPAGMPSLRGQVARWYVRAGCALSPDDVVITCGALEAIHLCLRAVTKPGDTIALESPTYWGLLQTIEMLGLKALEIPTHPRTGPSLEALEVVLSQNMVKAVVLIPTVNNPLGSIMPEENRRQLVAMMQIERDQCLLQRRQKLVVPDRVCSEPLQCGMAHPHRPQQFRRRVRPAVPAAYLRMGTGIVGVFIGEEGQIAGARFGQNPIERRLLVGSGGEIGVAVGDRDLIPGPDPDRVCLRKIQCAVRFQDHVRRRIVHHRGAALVCRSLHQSRAAGGRPV